jgi:hypothetical protein
VSFSISNELNKKLEHLKNLLSHVDPAMSTESLLTRLAELDLDKYDPVRKAERAKARQSARATAPKSARATAPKSARATAPKSARATARQTFRQGARNTKLVPPAEAKTPPILEEKPEWTSMAVNETGSPSSWQKESLMTPSEIGLRKSRYIASAAT